jgi:hypothetical protein
MLILKLFIAINYFVLSCATVTIADRLFHKVLLREYDIIYYFLELNTNA